MTGDELLKFVNYTLFHTLKSLEIDEPNITHRNSLERNVRDYKKEDRFDCIV